MSVIRGLDLLLVFDPALHHLPIDGEVLCISRDVFLVSSPELDHGEFILP